MAAPGEVAADGENVVFVQWRDEGNNRFPVRVHGAYTLELNAAEFTSHEAQCAYVASWARGGWRLKAAMPESPHHWRVCVFAASHGTSIPRPDTPAAIESPFAAHGEELVFVEFRADAPVRVRGAHTFELDDIIDDSSQCAYVAGWARAGWQVRAACATTQMGYRVVLFTAPRGRAVPRPPSSVGGAKDIDDYAEDGEDLVLIQYREAPGRDAEHSLAVRGAHSYDVDIKDDASQCGYLATWARAGWQVKAAMPMTQMYYRVVVFTAPRGTAPPGDTRIARHLESDDLVLVQYRDQERGDERLVGVRGSHNFDLRIKGHEAQCAYVAAWARAGWKLKAAMPISEHYYRVALFTARRGTAAPRSPLDAAAGGGASGKAHSRALEESSDGSIVETGEDLVLIDYRDSEPVRVRGAHTFEVEALREDAAQCAYISAWCHAGWSLVAATPMPKGHFCRVAMLTAARGRAIPATPTAVGVAASDVKKRR